MPVGEIELPLPEQWQDRALAAARELRRKKRQQSREFESNESTMVIAG
ncbi:MAG: hypothetical protein GY820_00230 [Gammaproteobacteria bacterium]|nr:hypothetical protein [Gammaproteobacteria bacterium]